LLERAHFVRTTRDSGTERDTSFCYAIWVMRNLPGLYAKIAL